MRRFLNMYKPFTLAGIQEFIVYKANFLFFVIGEILYSFIMFFVWKAVFLSSDSDTFMGFTMINMVVYLFMTYLSTVLTGSDMSYAIGEEIVEGSIAMRLIKPVNYDTSFFFQELGNKIIMIGVMLIPLTVSVEVYRYVATGTVMFDGLQFLTFIISILFGYIISFYFNMCFGFLAFWLKNLWGANMLKESIIKFLSGAVIPIAFLPPVIGNVLNLLPFASLTYTPVMIYMGMYDASQTLFFLGLQVFWMLVFFGLSKFFWNFAIKRLCVQGG